MMVIMMIQSQTGCDDDSFNDDSFNTVNIVVVEVFDTDRPTLGRENKTIVPECSKRLKFANPSVGLKNLVPSFFRARAEVVTW